MLRPDSFSCEHTPSENLEWSAPQNQSSPEPQPNHLDLARHLADPDSPTHRLIQRKAERLVRSHPGFSRSDAEDVAQELAIALIERAALYDPDRGSESTFLDHVVDSRLKTLVRHRSAASRDWRREAASLNAGGLHGPLSPDDWLVALPAHRLLWQLIRDNRTAIRRHDLALDLRCLLATLSEDLRRFATLLRRLSRSAARRKLGLSRRRAARFRRELRDLCEAAELGVPARKPKKVTARAGQHPKPLA